MMTGPLVCCIEKAPWPKPMTGPAMRPELEEQIEVRIERDILTSPGRKIHRWTAFSSACLVEGSWRYKDSFQILPAPAEAPRARQLFADHPFILDLSIEDSPSFLIPTTLGCSPWRGGMPRPEPAGEDSHHLALKSS
jgi:hypothetical protein